MRALKTTPTNRKLTVRPLARLSLALASAAALLSLASITDALARAGVSGMGAKLSMSGSSSAGRNAGRPGSNGGGKTAGGDHDRPHRPKWKPPLTIGIPVITTGVATPVLGDTGGSGQNSPGSSGSSGPSPLAQLRVGIPAANERRYVPDQVLVELSAAQSQALDALLVRHRLTRLESVNLNGGTLSLLRISDRRPVPVVLRALAGEGVIAWAQPNYFYTTQENPRSPAAGAQPQTGEPAQYALAKLRLPEAHELTKGNKVLVAVIDSTVDLAHPELAGMVEDSFNALATAEKPHAHGTAIAGAIVARAKLTGAAPQARILAVAAFSAKPDSAEGTTFAITKGIDWAIGKGAQVINMSFTGAADPQIERKLAQARQKGIVLIAAAGNAGPKSEPLHPAAYPGVIAVTATDADDRLFSGANQGKHIAVAAPGVDILLAAPGGAYQIKSGTSFAAAEVSGVVALMLERKPDLGQDGVRQILTATARDLGPKGVDPQFGAGLVDAYRAIMSIEPVVATTGTRIGTASR
jgi:hypothetical protein